MQYLLLLITIIAAGQLKANTYYFSNNSGNDSRSAADAQHAETPWKTLAKLNAIFGDLSGGDSVLFKTGESFEGAIIATKSGGSNRPIYFGAYGTGERPVITALSTLTGWTSTGSNIWETNCPSSSMLNRVLVNGAISVIGRYPNISEPNRGYLTVETSSGSSQITDNDLPSSPDWTGGEVVIRKARWVLDRNLITRHSGNTIDYNSESSYGSDPYAGYFIQNHPKTLDLNGEWYYRLNDHKLGMYFSAGDPSSYRIQASTVNKLVSITGLSNFVFENINFIGANNAAFELLNSQQVRIANCDILLSGLDAIAAKNSSSLSFENLVVNHTNNVAFNLDNCSNLVISGCKIKNTGGVPGSGKGDAGGYEAILMTGDNILIEKNEIDSSGYIGITFRGNLNQIRNNFITNFGFVKDDGAAIYTWNNIPNSPASYGTKITDNVISNGIGAPEGTQWPTYRPVSGIYMDDNTANVEITGNSIAECRLYGIYIHNAHEISLDRNTLFNNNCQIGASQDSHADYSLIRNLNMHNNVFFARDFYNRVAEFKTNASDIRQFGEFDNNYYCRPTDQKQIIYPSYLVNGGSVENALSLDEWKAMFGKDLSSQKAPLELPNSDYIRFEYNATGSPRSIPLDDTYSDVYNNSYSGVATLAPYTSLVLMKHAPATENTPASTCPGLGSISREEWDNITGNDISRIPLTATPDKTGQLAVLETLNSGEAFGARIRGYVCPPLTGNYTFLVSGDDQVELWLSTDENPGNKKKIASLQTWTGFHEFKKYPSQTSASINLQAGTRYYIEVLHKEGDGGDHFSVAWQLPNGLTEAPIPGGRLIPFSGTTNPPIISDGLNYKYYEGNWDALPDFNSLAPVKTGTTPNININLRNPGTNNYFGFLWEGYINIPAPGNYTFETISDDGSKLYFNSFYSPSAQALVNSDGVHAPWPATGTIYVPAAGLYPIAMTFFEKEGGELMEVYWTGPGIPRQLIPDVAFTKNAVVVTEGCPGTGTILHEVWNNVGGNDVPNIPLDRAPSSTGTLNVLETNGLGDQYGERMRGFICPPQTGAYTFLIAGDDAVELWLSSDDNPSNKVKIANLLSWTEFHQFDKFASQQSAPINLQAGHRYYIEVLHKEGGGGDHVTIAWRMPDGVTETPIRGNHLLPFGNTNSIISGSFNEPAVQSASMKSVKDWELAAYPNPFKTSATITLNPAENGEMQLEIYDLQGRKLQSFPARMMKSGIPETFTFSAQGFSPGVYVIRATTNTRIMYQKIVLSK